MDLTILRELFRNYQQWQASCESEGLDTLTGPDGQVYCFWDIQYLYETAVPRLARRQREAIELYLVHNMRESDAATVMGISPTNPVGIYATAGLQRIIVMIEDGSLPMYRELVA